MLFRMKIMMLCAKHSDSNSFYSYYGLHTKLATKYQYQFIGEIVQ